MTPMYVDHFGMAGAPFSIAPDPRFLFMSPQHREALAHLMYGVKSDDGFVVLTGDVGAGKTTVCRCLLEQLPVDCEVALIFNPKLSVLELLATVCEEFRIAVPEPNPGIKAYVDHLNAWLLAVHAKGRMAVLIIDEAQSLDAEVLEQVRLLTNLETNQRKLLRIILLGQPQLRDILARPDMAQLSQRIVARYHLGSLSRADTRGYVAHRLAAAGTRREVFSPAALEQLHRLSGGIPRLINVLADRALLGAYVDGKDRVDGRTVLRAGREVLASRRAGRARATLVGLGALGGTAAVVAVYLNYSPTPPPAAVPAKQAVVAPIVPAVVPTTLVAANAGGAAPLSAPAADKAAPVPAGKPPPVARKPGSTMLRQGSRGPAVERLRSQLAQVRGTPLASPPSPFFDAELAGDIRRFQTAEGLPVTGTADSATRARLGQRLRMKPPAVADENKEP